MAQHCLVIRIFMFGILCGVLETVDNSGGCVYSFQVWRPNQDILQRLDKLDRKCSELSMSTQRQIHVLNNQVLREMLAAKNLSHQVEKQLLTRKLEDVQLKISLKELKLELMNIKSENVKVRGRLEGGGGHGVNSGRQTARGDYRQIKEELTGIKNIVGTLKNGVGDLKAEWVLIKREITDVKSDNTQLKFGQNDLKSDTVKLKDMIEAVQGDTSLLKEQQTEIKSVTNKLKKTVSDIRNENVRIRDKQAEMQGNKLKAEQQYLLLRKQNRQLLQLIESMKSDNAKLKEEVIAMALSSKNMSHEDIKKWLKKLPLAAVQAGNVGSRQVIESSIPPKDCHELYKRGYVTSGVYQIKPDGARQLDNVYCEMLNKTGWTVIQRRQDGSLGFNRGWLEYKFGFGNLYGDYWAGTEMMHQMTKKGEYKLRVDLWDWEGKRAYAEFDSFKVDSEKQKYRLHIRGYSGDAGDSFSLHDGMAFSTEDQDNDLHRRNCAAENKGGWWFNSCYSCNLNGVYHMGRYSQRGNTFADGVVWYTYKETEYYSLKRVEMKVKPRKL